MDEPRFFFVSLTTKVNDNFIVLQKIAFSHKKFQFFLGVQCNKTMYVYHLWAKQFFIYINRTQVARKLVNITKMTSKPVEVRVPITELHNVS